MASTLLTSLLIACFIASDLVSCKGSAASIGSASAGAGPEAEGPKPAPDPLAMASAAAEAAAMALAELLAESLAEASLYPNPLADPESQHCMASDLPTRG